MMKKLIKAETLCNEILETKGTPKQFRNRIRSISYIYTKPFSEETFNSCFWHENENLSVHSRRLSIGEQFFFPETLGDFISICSSMSYPIYWDEETYTDHIDPRTSYR